MVWKKTFSQKFVTGNRTFRRTETPMNIKRKIFEFIIDQRARWDLTPGRSEIRKFFGGLTDDVDLHLEQLEREGLLSLAGEGAEEIAMTACFRPTPQLALHRHSLVGSAPLPETRIDGSIALDLGGMGVPMEPNMYALSVYDESMLDAGIQYGDIALLRHACPQRGDIVAVELDGRLLLRRYLIIAGLPHVLAENPFRPDLVFAHDLPMHGVYWGLIRTEPCRVVPDYAQRKRVTYSTSADVGSVLTAVPGRMYRATPASSASKCGRNGKTSFSKKAHTTRKKGPSLASHGTNPTGDWPKPPSGIELNDKAGLEYKAIAHSAVEDQPDYGWALRQAIRNYEAKEKSRCMSDQAAVFRVESTSPVS